jgi:peptidyl-prolyl cis-trans isomerase B (cyclophilin B)
MKKLLALFTACTLALCVLTGCGDSGKTTSETTTGSNQDAEEGGTDDSSDASVTIEDGELLSGTHHVEIDVQDYGKISVELDADTAPITVTNFIKLAQDGFYDGLTFHRIMSGFMIQGGDPLGNGTGGSDETIKGEFSDNGVENDISHTRGTISMARSNDPDSASSQFFIMHEDGTYLDGSYAAFGHVTDGMDVVDDICDTVEVQDSNGTVNAEDQPVITSITVID